MTTDQYFQLQQQEVSQLFPPLCFTVDDEDVGLARGLPGERGLQVRAD